LGLDGVTPHRVEASVKAGLLELVDQARAEGWTLLEACRVLQIAPLRIYRWLERREAERLADAKPGAAVHGLLDHEIAQIIELFHQWGEIDRSHRKLAHRGSYTGRVWVSPSSVQRVLAAHGLQLRRPPRPGRSRRRPLPDWVQYRPRQIWIYDSTHFTACGMAALAIMDLVSRKWITTVVSIEETHTQVILGFTDALETENLMPLIDARADGLVDPDTDAGNPDRPVLLAMSDNGPQMTSGHTREFMALHAIAQHFGRPGTPTDQAWIETLFGHIKAEFPHLTKIRDPALLRAELDHVQTFYNATRLHEALEYVTPDDEHQGRGPAIRKARQAGLEQARRQRLEWHRTKRGKPTTAEATNAG
jgi:transposase InsO family protein